MAQKPEKLGVIRARRDFLALKDASRAQAPGFLLLARENPDIGGISRVGLTVTKKLGGAVVRNRIKRRLRTACREIIPDFGAAGTDYVLIARPPAFDREFQLLLDDLKRALLRLHNNPT